MPSTTAVSISWDEERAELQAVLHSPVFARSPALSHLLSYLCEKTFAGATDQIKEYSVALDVFDRQDSFDQDTDSIVRVQANRLRKRLSEYYARDGAAHPIHITIPVGQYVPLFQRVAQEGTTPAATEPEKPSSPKEGSRTKAKSYWMMGAAVLLLAGMVGAAFLVGNRHRNQLAAPPYSQPFAEPSQSGCP